MKSYLYITSFLLFLSITLRAQNTLKPAKNSGGIKIGAKIIAERSGLLNLEPGMYPVYGCGMQLIKSFRSRYLSIESGVYLVTKAIGYQSEWNNIKYRALYRSINFPMNIRIEYKYFYLSTGPTCDYFVEQDLSEWMNQSALFTRKLYFGGNCNLGIQYSFREKMTMYVEGRYSKIVAIKLTDPAFTNIGFAFGFNYQFKSRSKKVVVHDTR
jgi:hypothetical protein